MRRNRKTGLAAVILLFAMAFSSCAAVSDPVDEEQKEKSTEEDQRAWEEAASTPYGKYPELVTYTLGQMSGSNNSNLPEGETYEDNAYTRYLREMLNIQNDNIYMENEILLYYFFQCNILIYNW